MVTNNCYISDSDEIIIKCMKESKKTHFKI